LVEISNYISQNKISIKTGKELISECLITEKQPNDIIKERGLLKITDENTLKNILNEVIQENENEWTRLKNGEEKLKMFILGNVIKKTKGQADPEKVKEIMENLLK
jgi:aspartyl-tRNA(Asn)/glutamyl-tRNA(Gln) amidotransferase subunit B